MLVLSRKPGESLTIGKDVKVTIIEVDGERVRVGIDAPRSMNICRDDARAGRHAPTDPAPASAQPQTPPA